jgi:anaerobic selenocysteine-containing dehydrogenase
VQALVVYNSNPAAVAPDLNAVRRGLAREDLFTVVLEHFQTDTADWADIVLPATTQLEHWDVHFAYGHLYATLNRPAIAPLGESRSNAEIFRGIAARMGLDEPEFDDDDLALVRQALRPPTTACGRHVRRAAASAGGAAQRPRPYLPYADGRLPHPERQVRAVLGAHAGRRARPAPTYTPPVRARRDRAGARRALSARPHLLAAPPVPEHHVRQRGVAQSQRRARVRAAPADAERRGLRDGARVLVHNDRGAFAAGPAA